MLVSVLVERTAYVSLRKKKTSNNGFNATKEKNLSLRTHTPFLALLSTVPDIRYRGANRTTTVVLSIPRKFSKVADLVRPTSSLSTLFIGSLSIQLHLSIVRKLLNFNET